MSEIWLFLAMVVAIVAIVDVVGAKYKWPLSVRFIFMLLIFVVYSYIAHITTPQKPEVGTPITIPAYP